MAPSDPHARASRDACNTKIGLGCEEGTPPLVFRSSVKGRACAHASYLDMALFIIARTPCLEDLVVFGSFSARDEKANKQLLSRLPVACLSRLKRLDILHPIDDVMLDPFQHLSLLQELSICVSRQTTLTVLSDMLCSCANIQCLGLLGCNNLVDISSLAKCTGLERLAMHGCGSGLTDLRALSSLTLLTHDSISECTLKR